VIENFEEFTFDLTRQELENVLVMERMLVKFLPYGGRHPVKQDVLCSLINLQLKKEGIDFSIIPTRLRKYFNYFRCKGKIPIIATGRGCYYGNSAEVIRSEIRSLEQRASQILRAADGLRSLIPD